MHFYIQKMPQHLGGLRLQTPYLWSRKNTLNYTMGSPCDSTASCVVFGILLSYSCVLSLGNGSRNFIVGLTNSDSALHAPVLWKYTLCGQYPGTVPSGATVSVHCTNVYQRRLHFRYVIVQFPLINYQMNICEVEVFTTGMIH